MKKKITIIGAGLSGLSAAATCAENECDVTIVSQYPSERAQSVMAEGGINAALDTKGENDSPDLHFADTMKGGCYLADEQAVWNLTHNAPELVNNLYHMGVQFNTENGRLDLRNFGGQKKKRTAFANSDTGKQLMTALVDKVRKYEISGKIKRLNHHNFRTLLLNDNVCCGCLVADRYSGEIFSLESDGVIICTGGMHGVFGDTTGSIANTGEVTAELFRLGLPLANLEMIQYHPTTVEIGGKRMLISEAARGEGGRLYSMKNGKKWYFMEEKYPEFKNLMPRDITAREIWKVSRTSPVYLDMTELDSNIMENKLSGLVDDCLTYLHKDIRREPIVVYPGIHYYMGGIYVDVCHRTAFENLYAAGECAAQYHGANRLGENSLLGAVYGGKVAAETACEECRKENFRGNIENIIQPEEITSAQKIKLNGIMLETLGVVRNEEILQNGLERIEKLKGNLPLLGKAMILSATERKESRGAHYREDYPETDEKFRKTTIAESDGKNIKISFKEIGKRG